MISCRRKKNAKAVQWTGNNIREMSDFLGKYYYVIEGKLSMYDYVIKQDEDSIPYNLSKEEFDELYEIVED